MAEGHDEVRSNSDDEMDLSDSDLEEGIKLVEEEISKRRKVLEQLKKEKKYCKQLRKAGAKIVQEIKKFEKEVCSTLS